MVLVINYFPFMSESIPTGKTPLQVKTGLQILYIKTARKYISHDQVNRVKIRNSKSFASK